MQRRNQPPPDEPSVSKSHRKDSVMHRHELSPPLPTKSGKKISKKVSNYRTLPTSQQQEISPSELLGNDYRALRKKYLLLEEESFGIEKELLEVEDEVKTLEEEKLALLDELVVLEGLVDPSELHLHRLHRLLLLVFAIYMISL